MGPTAVTDQIVLRRARGRDLPPILDLLADADLPAEGVARALSTFRVAEADERIVGVAGLEVYAADGVLRSVAVDPHLRGQGLGARLVGAILEDARAAGLRHLYLLTTTADAWFPRHGFSVIDRSTASPAVLASVEFRDACPASAVAMRLDLEHHPIRSPQDTR